MARLNKYMKEDDDMEELKEMKVGDLLDLLSTIVISNKDTDEKKEPEYLSKEEVLKRYPLFTPSSLSKAVKYQGLEYIKFGRSRYYSKDAIETWIESQKKKEIYNRFDEIKF